MCILHFKYVLCIDMLSQNSQHTDFQLNVTTLKLRRFCINNILYKVCILILHKNTVIRQKFPQILFFLAHVNITCDRAKVKHRRYHEPRNYFKDYNFQSIKVIIKLLPNFK